VTRRNRPGAPIEAGIEQQIREAQEKGLFDDLPGAGKPLPGLSDVYDPLWWVKGLVQREQISLLPPSLEIRREVEKTLAALAKEKSEGKVRKRLGELNARIRDVNARTISGPATGTMALDEEAIVERWRAGTLGSR
jgi:hypothetical protein